MAQIANDTALLCIQDECACGRRCVAALQSRSGPILALAFHFDTKSFLINATLAFASQSEQAT